jgi:hypothetical protein
MGNVQTYFRDLRRRKNDKSRVRSVQRLKLPIEPGDDGYEQWMSMCEQLANEQTEESNRSSQFYEDSMSIASPTSNDND